jgi:hypothetical protein
MPDDDLETLASLIEEAKRIADARELTMLVYLLDCAALELEESKRSSKKDLKP